MNTGERSFIQPVLETGEEGSKLFEQESGRRVAAGIYCGCVTGDACQHPYMDLVDNGNTDSFRILQ
jgi:hypothetical protein